MVTALPVLLVGPLMREVFVLNVQSAKTLILVAYVAIVLLVIHLLWEDYVLPVLMVIHLILEVIVLPALLVLIHSLEVSV